MKVESIVTKINIKITSYHVQLQEYTVVGPTTTKKRKGAHQTKKKILETRLNETSLMRFVIKQVQA